MRYLKQFTFYPGEWAPAVVSDGAMQIQLDVSAVVAQASSERNDYLTRLEDENETLKEQIATLLEKLNGR